MAYIEVEDLSFQYDEEPVLSDITFKVEPGEFVMLTGENGAAKTTLIKNILGIYKPKTGLARTADQTVTGKPLLTGYIQQEASQFNASFPSTVYELAQSGRYPKRKWFKRLTEEDHERVKWALQTVGIWNYKDARIGDLSGGQKQRLTIARTFAMDPDLYILDEPTTGMDYESRQLLYNILKEETEQRQKAVFMVTHDQDELQDMADRHLRLVREEGTQWRCFSLSS